ncbi:insulinase family protein [Kitasatospora sp. MBT63]|uniref:insulinase family protein n=1 Tax=Kitasatospora sp. MBT63 TaxID=1444768 RepID=UPI00053A7569|nr:insulinase family protein [Kitasatospora sp. MBT63]
MSNEPVAPVVRRELPDGRRVLVLPADDAVVLSLVLPTGARDFGTGGAAALELLGSALLDAPVDGAGTGLNSWLRERGAVAEAVVDQESVTLRCRVSVDGLGDCLPVFLTAVARPTLTDARCLVAHRELSELRAAGPSARARASRRLRELLFGSHPLGHSVDGSAELPALDAAQLLTLRQELLAVAAPVVVLACPPSVVPAALELLAGGLPPVAAIGSGTGGRRAPVAEVFSDGGINLRAADGGPRAWVAAGGHAPARTAPEAAAFGVLAEVCGGAEGSLLRRTLYEDFALECTVAAEYLGYGDCGLWQLELELDTEAVALTEAAVREVLELVANGRLPEPSFRAALAAARTAAATEAADPVLRSVRAAVESIDDAPGQGAGERDGGEPGAGDWAGRLARVTAPDVALAAKQVLRTYSVAVV